MDKKIVRQYVYQQQLDKQLECFKQRKQLMHTHLANIYQTTQYYLSQLNIDTSNYHFRLIRMMDVYSNAIDVEYLSLLKQVHKLQQQYNDSHIQEQQCLLQSEE